MLVDEAEIQRVSHKVLTISNAQTILEKLGELEDEHRDQYRTRWLWELIQNACDAAFAEGEMTIEVALRDGVLTFRHNGRPFTMEEIMSLIHHGSTKPRAQRETGEPSIGKFGTGFLATHLLSRTVRVTGSVGESGRPVAGFEFVLDRTGDTDAEISAASDRSLDEFTKSLKSGAYRPTNWTEFRYGVGAEAASVEGTVEHQVAAIPYIFAFNDSIGCIQITDSRGRRTFRKSRIEKADSCRESSLVVLHIASDESSSDAGRLAVFYAGDVRVVAKLTAGSGPPELEDAGDVPRLFMFLPLVGTSDLGVPVVLHNARFFPTEERDGIHLSGGEGSRSKTNVEALEACAAAIIEMARKCSEARWRGLHRLLRLDLPKRPEVLRGDDDGWFIRLEQRLLESLASLPLVETTDREIHPLSDVVVSVGDDTLSVEKLYRFAAPVFGNALISERISGECAEMATAWESVLGREHPIAREVVARPDRLVRAIRGTGGIGRLAEVLGRSEDATLAWLDSLVAAWPEPRRAHDLDGVLPDQRGIFRPNSSLSRDLALDEVLKDILDDLGTPIRSGLLHIRITNAQDLLKPKDNENDLVARIKDRLKKGAKEGSAPGFRRACVAFFGWLAQRNRWDDLRDTVPVVTLDREGEEAVSETSTREPRLVWPRLLWPEKARGFWNALPPRSILADVYAETVPAGIWSSLDSEGVVLGKLFWEESITLSPELLSRYALGAEIEAEQHGPASDPHSLTIGRVALMGTSEFHDALRGSRERASKFLRFVLEYVVQADSSWRRREKVSCSCSQSHEIIPCEWLAWMRHTQWIPRTKDRADAISTESLARLARGDADLATLVTKEHLQDFLDTAGINVLEQALLTRDESQRAEIRRKLAQLTRSLSEPQDIDALVENMEARRQAGSRWKANQTLGERVERLVRELLQKEEALSVDVHFKGYDLEAYVRADVAEEDVGLLDVGPMKIEIKTTRYQSVSLSGVQAKAATDDPGHFWLCVVPLEVNQPTESVTIDIVRAKVCFVEGIGHTLRGTTDELSDAAEAAREEGIELEHIDDIRFRVNHEVWISHGVSISTFVSRVVSMSRRR